MTGKEISRWADAAMFRSEPMPRSEDGQVRPRVTLINATPDPLGTLAATCAMYEGRVVRSLTEVTDEQRRQAFADMQATALQGPLETVQLQFLVEGVTRSFTHQMVRERQAFFAQESMRFAVVEGEAWHDRAAMPPSIRGNPERELRWSESVDTAQANYTWLVDDGTPAEDARGVMPHDMTTRLHWILDLRGLLHVAGLRTCTQAQFEWRLVMAQVAKAIRAYGDEGGFYSGEGEPTKWQWALIADAIRPVCYQTGRCGFMAKFDRACKIRDRVEANARRGRPSSEWHQELTETRCSADLNCPGGCSMEETVTLIGAISPYEWAADPAAAR